MNPTRFSYVLLAGTIVLIGLLHLGAPFLALLFAYFVLTKLGKFIKNKWIVLGVFILVLAGISYTAGHFIRTAVAALPAIPVTVATVVVAGAIVALTVVARPVVALAVLAGTVIPGAVDPMPLPSLESRRSVPLEAQEASYLAASARISSLRSTFIAETP